MAVILDVREGCFTARRIGLDAPVPQNCSCNGVRLQGRAVSFVENIVMAASMRVGA